MNAVDVEVEATNLCDDIYELQYFHREVIFECQSLLIFHPWTSMQQLAIYFSLHIRERNRAPNFNGTR